MPSLVSDGPVGCTSEVGPGDEPGPEAVGGVGDGIEAGSSDGGLDEPVDRLRMERLPGRPVGLSPDPPIGTCDGGRVSMESAL